MLASNRPCVASPFHLKFVRSYRAEPCGAVKVLRSGEWSGGQAIVVDEQPHERRVELGANVWFLVPQSDFVLHRRIGDRDYHHLARAGRATVAPPNETVCDCVGTRVAALHVFLPTCTLDEVAERMFGETLPRMEIMPAFSVDDPFLDSLLNSIGCALGDPAPECRLQASCLAHALSAHLLRAPYFVSGAGDSFEPHGRLSARQLETLRRYIEDRLSQKLSISEIAAYMGLSRAQFLRRFKASTGTSPHRWIVEARIRKAKELLAASTRSCDDIAHDCGFAGQTHLSTAFRRIAALSPAAYREQAR